MGLYPINEEEAKVLGDAELLDALCWAFFDLHFEVIDARCGEDVCRKELLRRMHSGGAAKEN